MSAVRYPAIPVGLLLLTSACSGGDPVGESPGTDPPDPGCDGSCATASSRLTVADVEQVLAQAIFEAQARNAEATVAVVDRVGNVLAVYRMGPLSAHSVRVDNPLNTLASGGLEGLQFPDDDFPLVFIDDQAAIAKAITGAYLSSEGNAFSTRTASQIVQENFNPGETDQPSGPLFGVQFSQLACSDFSRRFDGVGPSPGPHRSPLGLSADPGGFPLYKVGTVVGGVGVIADGLYAVDPTISDADDDLDEQIAYAATFGFAAPADRRGDRITLDGKTARFSDAEFGELASDPGTAPSFASIPAAVGSLVAVNGYFGSGLPPVGVIQAGTAFGQPESGIRADADGLFPGADAFVFVDPADVPRYPPIAGTDAATLGADALTQSEVLTFLREALGVTNRARAQIRRPLGSQARVTIAVVDTQGAILGMVRARDAPVFGADVSLQKARTAVLFSSDSAASFLSALPDAAYVDLREPGPRIRQIPLGNYVGAARSFVGNPTAFDDGAIAYSTRAIGNLARPFYPDGIAGSQHGPFSKRIRAFSVFSDGIQLDVALNAILNHVLFVAGAFPGDVTPDTGCAGYVVGGPQADTGVRVGNGLQIFPGGVPIYRGDTLVGGIGISGDGVDQDDMIAFLGTANASDRLDGAVGNAPAARRADTLTPQGVRLKYVQCPQAPFVDDDSQNVCNGR